MELRERPVESQENESALEDLPRADAVVVLGGELKRNKKGRVVAGLESKMRALGAIELMKRGLVERIIVTGGVAKEFPNEKSIAEAIEEYLIKKGVPSDKILKETGSKNTAENIENVLGILEREGVGKVLLETNEFHLPRAKQLWGNIFKKHGLSVEEAEVSAEKLLNKRSPHYQKLTSYYEFPSSLLKLPQKALTKGLYEFLRRVLIYVDREDKIARFLAQRIR